MRCIQQILVAKLMKTKYQKFDEQVKNNELYGFEHGKLLTYGWVVAVGVGRLRAGRKNRKNKPPSGTEPPRHHTQGVS